MWQDNCPVTTKTLISEIKGEYTCKSYSMATLVLCSSEHSVEHGEHSVEHGEHSVERNDSRVSV